MFLINRFGFSYVGDGTKKLDELCDELKEENNKLKKTKCYIL